MIGMDIESFSYYVNDILSSSNPEYYKEEPEKSISKLVKHLQFIPKYASLNEFKDIKDEFLEQFLYASDYTKLLKLIDRTTIKYEHPNRYTPLMAIVCNQNICNFEKKMVLDRLLEMGARLNSSNLNGDTALSMAVKRDDTYMMRYLLEHGASPNTCDRAGITPLMIAVFNLQLYHIAILYYYGADLTSTCAIFDLDVYDIAKITNFPAVIELVHSLKRS